MKLRVLPVWAAGLTCMVALLVGCELDRPDEHAGRFLVFGTEIEVKFDSADPVQAATALARLGQEFQRMHQDWHPWQDGALGQLNQHLPNGDWVRTTPDLIELIEASQSLERESGGLFNAAIGKLVHLWGFHTSHFPILEPPPADAAIAQLTRQQPSTLDIAIDAPQVRSENPAVQLDFSGVAKGLATRRACQALAQFDIADALISLGGDVMLCGPGNRDWRVAISDGARGVLATVDLAGPIAVFTSGNYYRYGEWNGERFSHILDPTSGYPVNHLIQATVIDSEPLRADAAATALVVAGPERWRSTAKAMDVHLALVIDGQGQIHMTEDFSQLLDRSRTP